MLGAQAGAVQTGEFQKSSGREAPKRSRAES